MKKRLNWKYVHKMRSGHISAHVSVCTRCWWRTKTHLNYNLNGYGPSRRLQILCIYTYAHIHTHEDDISARRSQQKKLLFSIVYTLHSWIGSIRAVRHTYNNRACVEYTNIKIDNEQYPVSELVKEGSGLLLKKIHSRNNDIHAQTGGTRRIISCWEQQRMENQGKQKVRKKFMYASVDSANHSLSVLRHTDKIHRPIISGTHRWYPRACASQPHPKFCHTANANNWLYSMGRIRQATATATISANILRSSFAALCLFLFLVFCVPWRSWQQQQ